MPEIGRYLPVYVAGVVDGEGGRQLHGDIAVGWESTTDPGRGVNHPDQ